MFSSYNLLIRFDKEVKINDNLTVVGALKLDSTVKINFASGYTKGHVEEIIVDCGISVVVMVPAGRLITIHELFRHTSGFTYLNFNFIIV